MVIYMLSIRHVNVIGSERYLHINVHIEVQDIRALIQYKDVILPV